MHWHQHRCSKLCCVPIYQNQPVPKIMLLINKKNLFPNCAACKFLQTSLCGRGSMSWILQRPQSCSLSKMKLFLTLNFFLMALLEPNTQRLRDQNFISTESPLSWEDPKLPKCCYINVGSKQKEGSSTQQARHISASLHLAALNSAAASRQHTVIEN